MSNLKTLDVYQSFMKIYFFCFLALLVFKKLFSTSQINAGEFKYFQLSPEEIMNIFTNQSD